MSQPTDARAHSRHGRFPDPRVSWTIGRTETRRYYRKIRDQDVWLILVGVGFLFIVLALPGIFGVIQDIGQEIAGGEPAIGLFELVFVGGWLFFLVFGLISGVGSEGEVDNQDGLLSIRPPKDIAGGLVVYILLMYLPFLALPLLAGGAGLAVGVGDPLSIIGLIAAGGVLHLTATLAGFAGGLWLKGTIRRSPWLTRLKPVLALGAILGYFWLAFTGRLWPWVTDMADFLTATPLGWIGHLGLITTPGGGASVLPSIGALLGVVVLVPVTVFVIVRGGEYVWFVDGDEDHSAGERRTEADHLGSFGERLNGALSMVGVAPSTRGIAVVVLLRGYRAPLQLAFVVVPFIFLIPVLDPLVRTGYVPEWFPWVVLLYGAWAAGAGFPLNILGNQGATLPRLLTSPVSGRQVLLGYLLASALAFVPITAALTVMVGHLADRPMWMLGVFAVASVLGVLLACVLAAGIGATFPRFSTIELTANAEAVLPSKTAFAMYSLLAVLASTAVGVISDELYRELIAATLSDVVPFGITVTDSRLFTVSVGVIAIVAIAVPIAYWTAVNRFETYRVS